MVCRKFSVFGYCSNGALCDQRHVHECPDWSNTGSCHSKRCRLPHVDRAGQIRRQTANHVDVHTEIVNDTVENSDGNDLSSEGEKINEIEDDDVDSEGLVDDVYINMPASSNHGLHDQDDFIQF